MIWSRLGKDKRRDGEIAVSLPNFQTFHFPICTPIRRPHLWDTACCAEVPGHRRGDRLDAGGFYERLPRCEGSEGTGRIGKLMGFSYCS